MVLAPHIAAGGGAVRVVQQGGRPHDLQLRPLGRSQPLGHAVDAFTVCEVVNRGGIAVPVACLFQCQHTYPDNCFKK